RPEKAPVIPGRRTAPGGGGAGGFLSPPQCIGGGGKISFPAKTFLALTAFAGSGEGRHSRLPDGRRPFPPVGRDGDPPGYHGFGRPPGGRDGITGARGIFGTAP